MPADELVIGYVAGAHGIRGGLRVKLFDPDSTSLQPGLNVRLRTREGELMHRFEVEGATPHPGTDQVRLRLVGIGDRNAAEDLRGLQVVVDRAELPPLDEDEYYLADLEGSAVWCRTEAGERLELGVVTGLSTNGVQDLLEVEFRTRRGRKRWLLPALPEFVVDIGEGAIEADLPEGFLPESLERQRVGARDETHVESGVDADAEDA